MLSMVTYLGVGIWFYTTQDGWSFVDALYFSVVTMSTVGYGDLCPTSVVSQAFTLVFIVVGVIAVFPKVSTFVNVFIGPVLHWMRDVLDQVFPELLVDIDGDGETDYKVPLKAWMYYLKNLLPSSAIILLLQMSFAFGFTQLEPWSFWTAMYHCFVTATTVGYGDTTPTSTASRLWASLHIMTSVVLLAALFNELQVVQKKRRSQLQQVAELHRKLDPKLLAAFDRNGDGIDRNEFVIGMLLHLKIVHQDDIAPFYAQFNKLDVDGSGMLTQADIMRMVENWRARASEQGHGSTAREMNINGQFITVDVRARKKKELEKALR